MQSSSFHRILSPVILLVLATLGACAGEDRSGEVPFAPTVRTYGAEVAGVTCRMSGEVTSSPNSMVTARGFYYGNDTLRVEVLAENSSETAFSVSVDSIKPGEYYVYAFAVNGIGTSFGDTLGFIIEAS